MAKHMTQVHIIFRKPFVINNEGGLQNTQHFRQASLDWDGLFVSVECADGAVYRYPVDNIARIKEYEATEYPVVSHTVNLNY